MRLLWRLSPLALALGALTATLACGDPQVIVPETLWAYVQPPHGALDISARVEGLVYFTHPVKDATKTEAAITMECRGAAPCSSPDASTCLAPSPDITVTYDAASQVARVTPSADLQTATCYVYVVAKGIEAQDKTVGPLPVEIRSEFETR